MHLSTVDRLVSKLGPVNALVENLCKRLLPNKVAHACTGNVACVFDWGCGVETGSSYASYCVNQADGTLAFLWCGC